MSGFLFCTSFEADVRIQLPIMEALRRTGERVAALSVDLASGYDSGRRLLERAGIASRVMDESDLPPSGAFLDGPGPHFAMSRLLHRPGADNGELDAALLSLIGARVARYRGGRARYLASHTGKMDWERLCGFVPEGVFFCAALNRYRLVIETARRDGIPAYNYMHGFMHPRTFSAPHEYWWVDRPVVWGERHVAGYAACGCPPEKLIVQAPGGYAGRTPSPRRRELFGGGRTLLVNAQGVQRWKSLWPFRADADLEGWIAGIAAALDGVETGVVYKEHPVNGRRFEAIAKRHFAGRSFRYVFDEVAAEDLAREADAAVMLASTTAIDFMVEGVRLVCFDPFPPLEGGFRWSEELTSTGAASAAATPAALKSAIVEALEAPRAQPAALPLFLSNTAPEDFDRFIAFVRRARRGS